MPTRWFVTSAPISASSPNTTARAAQVVDRGRRSFGSRRPAVRVRPPRPIRTSTA